ncbi:MAG: DUF3180 family protein [Jiangellaceae bacterium]
MRPTRIGTLVWVALAAAPVGWSVGRIVEAVSDALPPVPWVLPLLLAFLAAVLFVGARVVRGWVEDRRYDGRMDALRAARLLALGKAAAVFGAGVAGAYVGLGVLALDLLSGSAGRDRAILCGLVAVAAVVVSVAAIRLERACQVPPSDEDPAEADGTLRT